MPSEQQNIGEFMRISRNLTQNFEPGPDVC